MSALYLFATSLRPDAYINSLAYTIEHMGVNQVCIVAIKESESEVLASTVFGKIEEQLRTLCKGKYIETAKDGTQRDVSLANTEGTSTYERCLAVINRNTALKSIPLGDLGKFISTFAGDKECIVDVTALKKNLLVDVIAILLSLSFSKVYNLRLESFRNSTKKICGTICDTRKISHTTTSLAARPFRRAFDVLTGGP